jgi:uncharacterized Fe-S radical SAM superfamily protein PflX
VTSSLARGWAWWHAWSFHHDTIRDDMSADLAAVPVLRDLRTCDICKRRCAPHRLFRPRCERAFQEGRLRF